MSRIAVARWAERSKSVSVSRRPYVEPKTGWPTTRIATSSPYASSGTARTACRSFSSRMISGSVRSWIRAGRACAASQRARPAAAGSRTDSTICGASPRCVATRYSCSAASGSSSAVRVGRTSSPIASRNISSARGRSKPAAKARVNSLRTRPSAALSQPSSTPAAGLCGSSTGPARSVASSWTRRSLSVALRRTPSSSRRWKVAARRKSAGSSSSPTGPTATTTAPAAISFTRAVKAPRVRGKAAVSRTTRSISMRRSVLRASASPCATKTE